VGLVDDRLDLSAVKIGRFGWSLAELTPPLVAILMTSAPCRNTSRTLARTP
jgi:hypothetical protein